MSEHWRMALNDYIQKNNLGAHVQWTQTQAGPQNALSWTACVFFRGVEYGRGSATTLGAARELAAEQALRALSGA
ncbi:hypothetical protein BV20DRAFT_1053378 [Pilatotrama ljubarskyi]|nr:hypothetical protein BV20DRAFT_1053378 [Pilatotrama ljubarskyi]